MKSMVMAMLLATVSVAGEMRFQSVQPISVDRIGVAGVSQHSWLVEGGDDAFLFVWQDDRDSWPRFANRGFLAARVSADGTLLDEVPLSLPMWVEAVTRANDGWIAVGSRSIVRIGDDGTVSEVRDVPHPGIPFVPFELKGAAWTGQAVVVLFTSYTRSSSGALIGAAAALSFDADLNHVATRQLTGQPTYGLGIAGDGVSSAVAIYRNRSDGEGIRAAVFDVNGEYRKEKLVHSVAGVQPSGAVVATGPGTYAIAVSPDSAVDRRLDVMTLDTNMQRSYLGSLNGHWFPYFSRPAMFWDGSAVTMYTLTWADSKHLGVDLNFSHFTPGGQQELTSERLTAWDPQSSPTISRAGGRGLITTVSNFQPTSALRARMFGHPHELKSKGQFQTLTIDRGAFAQGKAAGASGESQSVVAWLERVSLSNPLAVYATRLDRHGKVLDPQSLLLGQSSCAESKPLVATNGSDFLAVWTSTQTRVAAIRADGTFETRALGLRTGTGCVQMQMASNGEDFLLVWPEKQTLSTQWDLVAVRLRADGTSIDTTPIVIASALPTTNGQDVPLAVASDGRDYLVAWNKFAVRVTSDGAALSRFQPILLGDSVMHAWWNGRTYVVQAYLSLLRIGTDGTGGAPLGLIPLPDGMQPGMVGLCNVGGCSFALFSWPADEGSDYGAALGRLEDDGTTFTMKQTSVADFFYPKDSDGSAPNRESFLLDAGRLLFVHGFAHSRAPYAGVQRLVVTPMGVPRTRAVSH